MDIITLASIISAALVVIGACWKIVKLSHNIMNKLEEYEEIAKKNQMHIMKLGLFNQGLPPQDRIQCGKTYIELGGNGTGKLMYEKLLRQMDEAIDAGYKQKEDSGIH